MITTSETRALPHKGNWIRTMNGSDGTHYWRCAWCDVTWPDGDHPVNDCRFITAQADLDRLARIEGLRERIQMEILKFEAFEPSEFVPIMRELLRLLPAEAAPDTRER